MSRAERERAREIDREDGRGPLLRWLVGWCVCGMRHKGQEMIFFSSSHGRQRDDSAREAINHR